MATGKNTPPHQQTPYYESGGQMRSAICQHLQNYYLAPGTKLVRYKEPTYFNAEKPATTCRKSST